MTVLDFFVVIAASLATVGLGVGMLHVLGLKNLPTTLLLGAGYGVGVIAVAKLLHLASSAGTSLTGAGWVTVLLGLIAGGWLVNSNLRAQRQRQSTHFGPRDLTSPEIGQAWYREPIIIALLILLAAHLSITLTNNLLRPIFPWDAFTTWMYRAKAWALQNSIMPMTGMADWIATGGQSGYALRAMDYPTALSIYAAFMSSLVGGWEVAAASIPWSICLLALCLATHGLIALTGVSSRLAVIGAYLMGSMPLLNIHAALAGYADIWMALYSGVGLAGLLIWRANGCRLGLWIGLLMLTLATQVKTEGWLWLGIGLAFILTEHAAARASYAMLIMMLAILAALAWVSGVTLISLGSLGQWGISDAAIHAGALGTYELRLFNPTSEYWDALFERANFLLLAGLYLLAMITLVMKWRHRAGPFWAMGMLIALSQLIIFGLSSYSEYAETSSASVRLLIHFTPVILVTVLFGWKAFSTSDASVGHHLAHAETPRRDRNKGRLIGSVALSVMTLLLISILPLLANKAPPAFQSSGEQMLAVVGRVKTGELGTRFVDSPINVGVLKAPTQHLIEPARYVLADVLASRTESISFYWINEGSSDVNSTPLFLSGPSLVDLHRYEAWRQGNKTEVGFLVNSEDFEDSYVRELSLVNKLDQSAFSALFNHWTSTETLTQKTINTATGHSESPYSLTAWLNLTLLLGVLSGAALLLMGKSNVVSGLLGTTLASLWVLGATVSLTSTPMLDCLSRNTDCHSTLADDPHARGAANLAALIGSKISTESPILIFDAGDALYAHKLPLLLLPKRSAIIKRVNQLPADWPGPVVLVGAEDQVLDTAAKRVASKLDRPQILRFEAARLVREKSSE